MKGGEQVKSGESVKGRDKVKEYSKTEVVIGSVVESYRANRTSLRLSHQTVWLHI